MRVKCIYPVLLVNLCLGYGNCTSTINEENNKTKNDFNIIEWYIMMSIFRFGKVLDNITALQNLNVYEFRTLVLVFTGVIWMFWKGWWPMVHILCKSTIRASVLFCNSRHFNTPSLMKCQCFPSTRHGMCSLFWNNLHFWLSVLFTMTLFVTKQAQRS